MEKMIEFYEKERFEWSYHGGKLVEYFRTGTMNKPCSCGFNYFFVRSSGEVFLCPLISEPVGNIKESPIEDLFCSEKAARIRKRIGKYPQCRVCTEPGLERYALPYQGFAYLSLLIKLGKRQFFKLHQHMGLDKYLG